MDLSLLQSMSFAGFLTLAILLLCSLTMVALGLELRKRTTSQLLEGEWLLAQLRYLLFQEEVEKDVTRDYLSQLDRPITRICRELLCLGKPTLEAGDYLLSGLIDRERLRLERGLSHLGTIAVIAPFVGLFGTVVGITKTFADVARMGKAGIEVVSAGVAEALVATAVGLVVAIVSVVLFNHFKTRFDNAVSEWDVTARALLSLLTSDKADQNALFSSINSQIISVNSAQTFLEARKEETAKQGEPEEGWCLFVHQSCLMDSICAPTPEGTYQTVFGLLEQGLFLQRMDRDRFCFRHAGSGHSLFYFLGTEVRAREILLELSARYDFQRDSTWVLKSHGEIHGELSKMKLTRRWLYRAWHYAALERADSVGDTTPPTEQP